MSWQIDALDHQSERLAACTGDSKNEFAVNKFAKTSILRLISLSPTTAARGDKTAAKSPNGASLKRIGQVGALAVALGVGAAIAGATGVAHADNTESSSPESPSAGKQESKPKADSDSSTPVSSQRKSDVEDDDQSPSTRRVSPKAARTATSQHADRSARATEASDGEDETRSNTTESKATQSDDTEAAVDDRSTDSTRWSTIDTSPAATIPNAPDDPTLSSILLAVSAAVRRQNEALAVTRTRTADAVQTTALSSSVVSGSAAAAGTANGDVVIQAESMSVSPSANGATYTDATASGGKALLLKKNSTATTKVALPEVTSLVIRAKGDQYNGAPAMTVSVNGKAVAKVSVTATSWTDYTIPFTAPAGTYTVSIAYTNDASGKTGDRNLRIDSIKAVAKAIAPPPPNPGTPEYFQAADWLWKPIPANPALAADSATWVSYLADPDELRIANLYDYSVKLVSASEITSSTPRYDITFTEPWGNDPFGSNMVPIPLGTQVPPGWDGQLAIQDPTTGMVYGIWQAQYNSATDTWSGSWGGMTALNGTGVDQSGSATASNISRYAGVITAEEFSAAIAANTGLNHALTFSTDIAGSGFVGPATKSDGQNLAGVAAPIPEGSRIQLDPSIDVDAIPGITPAEKVIAKTLQTYGAYVVDQGGARMAFTFELADDATADSPGSVWTNAGLAWDYYDMNSIPWSQLRVLAPPSSTTVAV